MGGNKIAINGLNINNITTPYLQVLYVDDNPKECDLGSLGWIRKIYGCTTQFKGGLSVFTTTEDHVTDIISTETETIGTHIISTDSLSTSTVSTRVYNNISTENLTSKNVETTHSSYFDATTPIDHVGEYTTPQMPTNKGLMTVTDSPTGEGEEEIGMSTQYNDGEEEVDITRVNDVEEAVGITQSMVVGTGIGTGVGVVVPVKAKDLGSGVTSPMSQFWNEWQGWKYLTIGFGVLALVFAVLNIVQRVLYIRRSLYTRGVPVTAAEGGSQSEVIPFAGASYQSDQVPESQDFSVQVELTAASPAVQPSEPVTPGNQPTTSTNV